MSRALASDTIVAIATPPGRGALAIVRLSGPRAIEIASSLIAPWPEQPRHATLARIVDPAGEAIDEGIVIWYKAPHSFTGEDAVEVTCHGGAIAPALVASALVASGARPALRGEFTRRAVLNGKLDVLQAEAVGDLIEADTRAAQRVALSQLDGGLSRRIASLRERVLQLEALVAYDIDFPEEDDGPVPRSRIESAADDLARDLQALLSTAPVGELAREGAVVVIAGAPNVGKSSLFNALLGRRRAIVTEVPGTTRDAIEAVTEADGWPIRLVDTAGMRESADAVERIGIQVSRDYVGRADVVLVCGDDTASLAAAQRAVTALSDAPVVLARTKADIAAADDQAWRDGKRVFVSAETGDGLHALLGAIAQALHESKGRLALDAPMITRERHRSALAQALEEVRGFREALSDAAIPPVVAAVHLREATRCLDELIGGVDVEDVLDRLFSSFCVGK